MTIYNFLEHQDKINCLTPKQRDRLPADLVKHQQYLDRLVSNSEELRQDLKNYELGQAPLIKHLVLEEYLDVLIDIYNNPEFNEDEAPDPATIEAFKKSLTTERARLLNQINRDYAKKSTSENIKNSLYALSPSKLYPNAYEYNNNSELQLVVGKIAEYFMKNGEETPITFTIDPNYDSENHQNENDRNKQIVENVLTAAAKNGYTPDQIKIVISGVPQATSKKELKGQYTTFVDMAQKFKEKVVGQVKTEVLTPRA